MKEVLRVPETNKSNKSSDSLKGTDKDAQELWPDAERMDQAEQAKEHRRRVTEVARRRWIQQTQDKDPESSNNLRSFSVDGPRKWSELHKTLGTGVLKKGTHTLLPARACYKYHRLLSACTQMLLFAPHP